MKLQGILLAAMLCVGQAFVLAHADDAASEANATASVEQSAAASKTVPKLAISWACGDCTVNDKVIPQIEEAYANAAAAAGKSVSATDSAEVSIVDFRQRNPGMRVMFGFMAGKDRLGVKIKYRDHEYTASDYSANAMQGMNALCSAVGRSAYVKLAGATAE